MTKYHSPELRKNIEAAVIAYVAAFEAKHDVELDELINNNIFGMFVINGDFFSIVDVVYDIDNNLPKEMIYEWLRANEEVACAGHKPMINLPSWSAGVRYETIKLKK